MEKTRAGVRGERVALEVLVTPVLLRACQSLGHGMILEDISKRKRGTQDLSFFSQLYINLKAFQSEKK